MGPHGVAWDCMGSHKAAAGTAAWHESASTPCNNPVFKCCYHIYNWPQLAVPVPLHPCQTESIHQDIRMSSSARNLGTPLPKKRHPNLASSSRTHNHDELTTSALTWPTWSNLASISARATASRCFASSHSSLMSVLPNCSSNTCLYMGAGSCKQNRHARTAKHSGINTCT